VEEFCNIKNKHPTIKKWMVGRGILRDPWLAQKIRNGEKSLNEGIPEFFRSLTEIYRNRDFSDHIILRRLKTLVIYLGEGFEFEKSQIKRLRKTRDTESLLAALNSLPIFS
jgi:tRNA-dihydrouridine synthase